MFSIIWLVQYWHHLNFLHYSAATHKKYFPGCLIEQSLSEWIALCCVCEQHNKSAAELMEPVSYITRVCIIIYTCTPCQKRVIHSSSIQLVLQASQCNVPSWDTWLLQSSKAALFRLCQPVKMGSPLLPAGWKRVWKRRNNLNSSRLLLGMIKCCLWNILHENSISIRSIALGRVI